MEPFSHPAVLRALASLAGSALAAPAPVDSNQVIASLAQARTALDSRKGKRDLLQHDQTVALASLEAHQVRAKLYEQVGMLLERTATHARETAKTQIESLVTSFLQAVFGSDYSFKINLVKKGDRDEAQFRVVSPVGGELVEMDPEDSRGGGVVDLVSLGLRIAMLQTYRPALQGPLTLDEPCKHVSADYIPAAAQLLGLISQQFGRQVIMVTHNDYLSETAETVYHVALRGDRSIAELVGSGAR